MPRDIVNFFNKQAKLMVKSGMWYLLLLTICFFHSDCVAQNNDYSATHSSVSTHSDIDILVQHESPINTYKTNYFSINNWPGNKSSQAKFQISMKFSVLKPDLYIFKRSYFPIYIGYTQKSLWNIGQPSAPFEETNYNPELFLDYQVNRTIYNRLKLRNITVGLFEHESNGMSEADSRSWNRQYIMCKFGLEPEEHLNLTGSFIPDKMSFYVKLWIPSDYSDQDNYLHSRGSDDDFLDYAGRGEVSFSIRNFLWGGALKDHQLDIKTPIFHDTHKPSWQFEFRQQIPRMNFSIYFQYWYGHGESLLRFDQFGHRGFAGVSFSY